MHAFADLDAVHDTLERLIARGLVARQERRPGQKEERYGHLLSADLDGPSSPAVTAATPSAAASTMGGPSASAAAPNGEGAIAQAPPAPSSGPELGGLEERVARLERAVDELRATVRA
jgi:uncharacterized protein YceH (UPF0502 family)